MEPNNNGALVQHPDQRPSISPGRRVLSGLAWAIVGMISVPITYLMSTDVTGQGQDLQTIAVAWGLGLAGLVAGLVFGVLMAPQRLRTHGVMILAVVLLAAVVLLLAM